MFVGYGALVLHIPHARDLKSKRRAIRGLIDRLHARLKISVAETACHDLVQRSEIGVAIVTADRAQLEQALERIGEMAEREMELVVLDWNPVVVEEER